MRCEFCPDLQYQEISCAPLQWSSSPLQSQAWSYQTTVSLQLSLSDAIPWLSGLDFLIYCSGVVYPWVRHCRSTPVVAAALKWRFRMRSLKCIGSTFCPLPEAGLLAGRVLSSFRLCWDWRTLSRTQTQRNHQRTWLQESRDCLLVSITYGGQQWRARTWCSHGFQETKIAEMGTCQKP